MNNFLNALCSAGGEIFEVGGVVRDRLMNLRSKDADYLCRNLTVEQITNTLKEFGKVSTVGASFGVIKFVPHTNAGTEIDFALPRKELSTGKGHRDFDVSFDPNLAVEIDLGRRDFTINAMARNISTDEIIDPFAGKADLAKRQLRMVFPEAFIEDPLRMLRAVQFSARFDLKIEATTLSALKQHADLLSTVSPERITLEIAKLLQAKKPSQGFYLMAETGLLAHVSKDLAQLIAVAQDKQPGDDVFAHTMRVLDAARSDEMLIDPGEINLLFAALLHDIGKPKTARYHEPSKRVVFFGHQNVSARLAKKWMKHIKVETIGVDPKLVVHLVRNHMFETKAYFSERAIRRFIAKIGKDSILKLLDLRFADNRGGKYPDGVKGVLRLRKRIQEELAKKPPFGAKDLAVNGNMLIDAGIDAGPLLGKVLQHLVNLVLDDPQNNTQETLLAPSLYP